MLYYIVNNIHANKASCCYSRLWRWLVVCRRKGGVRGDTWMGDLWFVERKANVSNINRQPKLTSARIFISLSIPLFVQLVKYARWLVTDF